MKKFLILSALLFALPSYSMCAVDGGDTVCSLPNFREQVSPIYKPQSGISEFSGTPEARLRPLDRKDIMQEVKGNSPAGSDLNYNSSCQFGVCLQNRSTPLFQQPVQ